MPQIATALVTGAVMLIGYTVMKRLLDTEQRLKEARVPAQANGRTTIAPRNLGALVWDDAAGVYRPRT